MLTSLRKRMSYANVTATLALFFAMSGGALAASHYLITSTKQIKPSVLSSLKGKAGKAGAAGANGAPGPQGPAGASGAGTPGPEGKPGANGVSPEGSEFAVGTNKGTCTSKQGGVEFKGATVTYACNGKNGTTGFTETLPEGKTEKGTWAVQTDHNIGGFEDAGTAPISFAIPLAAALNIEGCSEELATRKHPCDMHYLTSGEAPTAECKGTAANPEAASGQLCLYEEIEEESVTFGNEAHPMATGGAAITFVGNSLNATAAGSWAVTAP